MALPAGYLDAYIEKCPAFGWQGGPAFKTTIVTMRNGRERRNAEQEFARHSFSAPFRNIKAEAYMGIKQMHLVCRGMLRAFKFKDQLDHSAVGEVFGEGDGVTKTFQLRKVSVISGVSYVRNTYVIRPGGAYRVAGVSAAHTVDLDRGTVTFTVAPANHSVLSGDWEFDVWVRFAQDDLPFSLDNRNSKDVFINGSVNLIEVPPPAPV